MEWRQIRGSRYCVSSEGAIKRIGTGQGRAPIIGVMGRGRALKWNLAAGRPSVCINVNPEDRSSKAKGWSVAELVLETFVGPKPSGAGVRWRNNDRSDCSVENLSWAPKEQLRGLDWVYRPGKGVSKAGQPAWWVIAQCMQNPKVGASVLGHRFGFPASKIQEILDRDFDPRASKETGYMVSRHSPRRS